MIKMPPRSANNAKTSKLNGYLAIRGLRRHGAMLRMKTWLQHHLHPMHLWSRLGSNCLKCFKQYEAHIWQPLLRRWLQGGLLGVFFQKRSENHNN
jgi:hypothetical protein